MARPDDDPTDLDADEAVMCIDCGERNDNAVPGETCPCCGGTYHCYQRVGVEARPPITAADLDENRVRWEVQERQYRALMVLLEDIETGEYTAVRPRDLRNAFSVVDVRHR